MRQSIIQEMSIRKKKSSIIERRILYSTKKGIYLWFEMEYNRDIRYCNTTHARLTNPSRHNNRLGSEIAPILYFFSSLVSFMHTSTGGSPCAWRGGLTYGMYVWISFLSVLLSWFSFFSSSVSPKVFRKFPNHILFVLDECKRKYQEERWMDIRETSR